MNKQDPDKMTQAEIAEQAGVSVKTLHVWREKEGIDITDVAAVMERAKIVAKNNLANEDLGEIKRRQEIAKTALLEHKLEVERGKYVSHVDMVKDGTRAGMLVRNILQKMPGELTPRIAGKDSAAVEKELSKWSREIMLDLSRYETLMSLDNDGN